MIAKGDCFVRVASIGGARGGKRDEKVLPMRQNQFAL